MLLNLMLPTICSWGSRLLHWTSAEASTALVQSRLLDECRAGSLTSTFHAWRISTSPFYSHDSLAYLVAGAWACFCLRTRVPALLLCANAKGSRLIAVCDLFKDAPRRASVMVGPGSARRATSARLIGRRPQMSPTEVIFARNTTDILVA